VGRQDGVLVVLDEYPDRFEGPWHGRYPDNRFDNLNGFADTIRAVFPQSTTQIALCIRSATLVNMLSPKDMKVFTIDMKEIYTSANREQAMTALVHFEQVWSSKYRHAVQSWHHTGTN